MSEPTGAYASDRRDCEGRSQDHPRYADCCHEMSARVALSIPEAKDALRFIRHFSGPGDTLPPSVEAWNFLYTVERYVAHYDKIENKEQDVRTAKKRLAEAEAELRRLTEDEPSPSADQEPVQ